MLPGREASLQDAESCAHAPLTDPSARYRRRQQFYCRYGYGRVARYGYGTSELAFLRWLISRGALGPWERPPGLRGATPLRATGSPWWRAVNDDLIFVSERAAAVHEGLARDDGSRANALWLTYLRAPSGLHWYRAHTFTVVTSYMARSALARLEPAGEQALMNEVLYRLLHAQVLIEGASRVGAMGSVVADPRLFAVPLLIRLPQLYPREYPLVRPRGARLRYGDRVTRTISAALDERLFAPGLQAVYALVSEVLELPDLRRLICDCEPIYPHHDKTGAPSHG